MNHVLVARVEAVCVGECMVELSRRGPRYGLQYGGDTFNTAAYMARAGAKVAYATALGDDPYSDGIAALIASEKVDGSLIPRVKGRNPGLYIIETDAQGERSFHYWRDRSPARELFELPEAGKVAAAMAAAKFVYFSGITLSLYSEAGLDAFETALIAARQAGAKVAFDGNFRPRGWGHDLDRARAAFRRFLGHCDIALPTFDDEQALWGDTLPAETFARLKAFGVSEIGIKLGASGVLLSIGGDVQTVAVPRLVTPLDTTAAGDSFNGGYLAARLQGAAPDGAALTGHAMAGAVIQHRGAIVPKTATRAALKGLQ
ncbi:MAG: sugar kinase [Bosea sp. (in: a-proteobacteria)]